MINIKWSLLCRKAKTAPDGTGTLTGVVEDYTSPSLPLQIDQMTVVLGAELSGGTRASIEIRLILNGSTLARTDPSLNHFTIEGNDQVVRSKILPINLGKIILPEFGDYTLEVIVNGQQAHVNSFRLLKSKILINPN